MFVSKHGCKIFYTYPSSNGVFTHVVNIPEEAVPNGAVPSSSGQEFTAEDAVESMGLGWFQVKIFLICGFYDVSNKKFSYYCLEWM